MKISRYIYVPFFMGASYALCMYLILGITLNRVIESFLWFALFGFGLLFYNDYRVRKLTSKDNKEAFNVRQKRTIVLFANYDKVFDLCLESVRVLKKGKIKYSNGAQGIIKAKTSMNWQTWGNVIDYKLSALTETTTEVEVTTRPIFRTALVDNGEGFKVIEDLTLFFDKENERINRKYVEGKTSIPIEFHSDYKNNKVKVN